MKRMILVSLLTLVLSVAFGLVFAQAEESTWKFKEVTYLTKLEAIPVPDVEGHIVGFYERRGLYIFEHGEVGAFRSCGTFDYIKGQGSFQGYAHLTSKGGCQRVYKYHGTETIPPGEKLSTVSAKGEYIKGTGRLKGIKGKLSGVGKSITPFGKKTKGDMIFEGTTTYTLPSQ
jgi:hypothetical protein